jgi:hypothetical protein
VNSEAVLQIRRIALEISQDPRETIDRQLQEDSRQTSPKAPRADAMTEAAREPHQERYMIFRRKKSPLLLDLPFLSETEVAALRKEIEAVQKGEIKTIVGTPYWDRAIAELSRQQINAQLAAAQSLTRATWTLIVVTFLVAVATISVGLKVST